MPRRAQNLSVSLTHTPSPSFVNDVRFGYNRVSIGVFGENTGVSNGSVGLPSLSANPRDAGLSVISVSGYSSLGHEYTTPQESTSDTFQIADTATWLRGAHMVKFGGEWNGVRQQAYRDVQSRGFLTFLDQGYTGNALADLLLGLPVLTGGARLDNPQNLRAGSWSVFASGRLARASQPRHLGGPAVRLLLAGRGRRRPREPVRPGDRSARAGGHRRDSARRLRGRTATTWRRAPASPGRSIAEGHDVLRGGYGIYYNQGSLATAEGLYFNPPYFNLGVYFPAQGLPPLTLADPFPVVVPRVHSSVGDRVPARSPDAMARAVERQRAAPDRADPFARAGVRRIARTRPHLRA